MLLIIVATGNHFILDAAAGALVVAAGWLAASRISAPALAATVRLPAPRAGREADWAPSPAPSHARAA